MYEVKNKMSYSLLNVDHRDVTLKTTILVKISGKYGVFEIFIGPRSDHSLPMSVTDWLTNWLTNDLVEDWMNWPECADFADYVHYADFAEYA